MIFRSFVAAAPNTNPVTWTFQPKQEALLSALEATGDVATVLGMAGSRGSAKSGALRGSAIYLATTYPGVTIYIVRRVLGDLLENHMEPIKRDFPPIHHFYRAADYEYPLPGGSRIVYVYAENTFDVERVSYGPECTFLFIDQAEQFSENELISFRICNRWPSAARGFVKTCYFFNVGVGQGAGYLRRIFHLRSFKGNERPADYKFFHVYGWDNYEWFRGQTELTQGAFYELPSETRFTRFITDTSEGRKMDALPKHRRAAELLGDFDSFSGQYFSDVWGEHVVLTKDLVDRLIQPWWTRWMAQDWGFGDHDCNLWFASGKVSPTEWTRLFGGSTEWPIDVAVVYRENVVAGRAEADLANDIVNQTPMDERRYITDFWLSQDAFGQRSKQGENTVGSVFSEIMGRNGLPAPYPADQNRITGWRAVYNCLRQASMRGGNIDKERALQGPALFVSVDCPNVIENVPLAVRDEKNNEDVARVAGAVWEDVTDALRYGVKSKLAPKSAEPFGVKAEKIARAASNPTDLHMRMLHLEAERTKLNLMQRAPRWR